MHSEGSLSHYRMPGDLPLSCRAPASPLLLLPGLIYISGHARDTLTRPAGPRLCVYGRAVPPRSNKNRPAMFTILPSAEDIRIACTFIQITAWYRCTLLLWRFFFFLRSQGRWPAVGSTQTRSYSLRRAVIFPAPLLMKQTDLQSVRCITRPLITAHYSVSCLTFIHGGVVTRGSFSQTKQSHLFIRSSGRPSTVQECRFQGFCSGIFFIITFNFIAIRRDVSSNTTLNRQTEVVGVFLIHERKIKSNLLIISRS